MRKIRAAAAVAAMVAGLGMVGAGTAFAGGHPPVFEQNNTAACEASAEQNTNALINDVNLLSGIAVGVLGQAEAEAEVSDTLAPRCTNTLGNEID